MAYVVCAELGFNPIHSLCKGTRHNCRIVDQYMDLLDIGINAGSSFADRGLTTEIEIDELGPDCGLDCIDAINDWLDFAQ